jgi:hypothetical protein
MKSIGIGFVGAALLVICLFPGCRDKSRDKSPDVGTNGSSKEISEKRKLSAALTANAPTRLGLLTTSDVQGLYMGELEIVAYNYRPNAAVQARWSGDSISKNWSHWVALQNGTTEGRDNVLKIGEAIDFDKFADGPWRSELDANFIDAVGQFQIDLFEVNLYRTGVVFSGAYYGMNAELNGHDKHPLHKYESLKVLPDHSVIPAWPGFPTDNSEQSQSIIFARSDWFPNPVSLQLRQTSGSSTRHELVWSSSELSEQQKQILLSMADEGTCRRFYANMVILPFGEPVVIKFPPRTPAPDSSTSTQEESGSSKQNSTPLRLADSLRTFDSTNFKAYVEFNLSDIIDSRTDLNASPPRLVYKGDANNVPFGISIRFGELKTEDR